MMESGVIFLHFCNLKQYSESFFNIVMSTKSVSDVPNIASLSLHNINGMPLSDKFDFHFHCKIGSFVPLALNENWKVICL